MGNPGGVQDETDKGYEPAEDPDTGPATTPEDVERDSERDQAEGEEPAPAAG
jgi:hypothetical protein